MATTFRLEEFTIRPARFRPDSTRTPFRVLALRSNGTSIESSMLRQTSRVELTARPSFRVHSLSFSTLLSVETLLVVPTELLYFRSRCRLIGLGFGETEKIFSHRWTRINGDFIFNLCSSV